MRLCDCHYSSLVSSYPAQHRRDCSLYAPMLRICAADSRPAVSIHADGQIEVHIEQAAATQLFLESVGTAISTAYQRGYRDGKNE